ncbi:unnamed protein product [Heterobilharzia americana]|nr:unnamed protein product [Heterobilharzia americana]
MICISWIFPAALFTPVIFGWSHLTGEPKRDVSKCEVSFTYYPIFNTTLTLGYFWITLIVMCSLYAGIYKVARRLQKKSVDNSRRMVQLLSRIDKRLSSQTPSNPNSLENENNTHNQLIEGMIKSDTLEKCTINKHNENKFITNSKRITQKYCFNESKDVFIGSSDSLDCNFKSTAKNEDNKPELYTLTSVNDEYQCTSPKEIRIFDSDIHVDTLQQEDKLKHNFQYRNLTIINCSTPTIQPLIHTNKNNNYEEDQINSKCILPTFKDKHLETNRNESLSSYFDEDFSLPSINFYVPSPKVSISSPIHSNESISPKYTNSENNSPIWIKKAVCYDSGLNLCECDFCLQLINYQIYKNDGKFYENGIYLSDSTSWEQCIPPTCCPLDKCEYSDYSTSFENTSSLYDNQSTGADYWCIRFVNRLSKSNDKLIKSICIGLNRGKHYSPSLCKSPLHKNHLVGFQSNYNNQEVYSCHHYSNNMKFIHRYQLDKKETESQTTEEQTKTELKCSCCILPPKNKNINLNNHHLQGQLSGTNSDNSYTNVKSNQQNVKPTKLSLKSKRKQQTRLSVFQSLSNIDMQNRKHARKALKTISFILGAFMICWTPYHIIVLIKGFCDNITTHTSCVNIHLYNLSYWLCYMNSPINPFCYALSNISFRRTFFRILRCDFQKR